MAKFRILRSEYVGEDIDNSTDIWKFVMHEGYPTQKVALSGSATVTILDGFESGFTEIEHGLGYVPKCRVAVVNRDGYVERISGGTDFYDSGLDEFGYYSYTADDTYLYLYTGYYATTASGDEDYTFYYIILHD